MRFISNAFIVTTVALLSLIIPVVNADPVAVITKPSAGQSVLVNYTINVIWDLVNRGAPDVNCDIALVHYDCAPDPDILQSDVPLLSGESKEPVTIPDVPTGDNYVLELLSTDQKKTIFGKSDTFMIIRTPSIGKRHAT